MISSEKITELRRSESAAVLDLLQIQFTKKNLASPSLDLRQQGCNAEWTERCDWVLGVLGREAWCNTSMTLKLVLALQTVGGTQNVPKGNPKGAPIVPKQQNGSNIKSEEEDQQQRGAGQMACTIQKSH